MHTEPSCSASQLVWDQFIPRGEERCCWARVFLDLLKFSWVFNLDFKVLMLLFLCVGVHFWYLLIFLQRRFLWMLTSRLASKNVSPLLLSVNIHVLILVSTSVLVLCVANMILGYLTAPAHTHT